mgnify:CR=1 FL=1
MIDAGFNLVSLATNHTLDRGEKAVINSCNYWDSKEDVMTAGSYCSFEDRNEIQIMEKNNISYSLLSYTYGTNGKCTTTGCTAKKEEPAPTDKENNGEQSGETTKPVEKPQEIIKTPKKNICQRFSFFSFRNFQEHLFIIIFDLRRSFDGIPHLIGEKIGDFRIVAGNAVKLQYHIGNIFPYRRTVSGKIAVFPIFFVSFGIFVFCQFFEFSLLFCCWSSR